MTLASYRRGGINMSLDRF